MDSAAQAEERNKWKKDNEKYAKSSFEEEIIQPKNSHAHRIYRYAWLLFTINPSYTQYDTRHAYDLSVASPFRPDAGDVIFQDRHLR